MVKATEFRLQSCVCLWDAVTGRAIGVPLEGHELYVRAAVFSPDGYLTASGSDDHTIRLWPAPKSWPEELCRKLSRNMSLQEWRDWVSPEIEYLDQCPQTQTFTK